MNDLESVEYIYFHFQGTGVRFRNLRQQRNRGSSWRLGSRSRSGGGQDRARPPARFCLTLGTIIYTLGRLLPTSAYV